MRFLKLNKLLTYSCAVGLMVASNAYAVGTGDDFGVAEGQVANSMLHQFQADSVDLTYHACDAVDYFPDDNTDRLSEIGYFWVSSYQDDDSVLDSQINHFMPNGYRIYGIYQYQAVYGKG